MYRSIIFILTLACGTHAAEIRLSVEGAANYALKHQPNLAAARFRIEEARGRLEAAGRLSNPEAEFEFRQNPRSPERSFGVAWMQKFPVTARLRLEKAVSRAELAAATAEVQDAERKLAGEVRTVATGLLALEKERELRGRQILNSEELSAFLTKRVQAGEASTVDAAQVDLETKQLGTQLLQLDLERTKLLGQLRPLLGVRSGDPIAITGELGQPNTPADRDANPSSRGDYRAAQAMAEAAQQNLELARARRWEDVGVGLLAEHERTEDAPEGFKRETMLGFKFSLPMPLWNKNEGQIREAIAAGQRAKKELEAVEAEIRFEAAAARGEMAALARMIADIDEKLIPQSLHIEEQLRSSYAAGQTTLPEVVRARGRRFELEAQRLSALRDYHLARAKYQTALGHAPSIPKTSKK